VPQVDVYVSGRNLHTDHAGELYPGIRANRPGPGWPVTILIPLPGQSFVALGGEHNFGYETPTGEKAVGFELAKGDRATLVRSDLPACLAEWRVERAT
jgi:hypothetical protein